jgi:CHAT domain-containing protein
VEALERFEWPAALGLLRESWESDPSYFPAVVELLSYLSPDFMDAEVLGPLRSLAEAQGDPRRVECFRSWVDASVRQARPAGPLPPATPAEDCSAYVSISFSTLDAAEKRPLVWALRERYPESRKFATLYLESLDAPDAWTDLVEVGRELAASAPFGSVRAAAYARLSAALHRLGRHEEALAAEAEGGRFAGAAPPGVRLEYALVLREHAGVARDPNTPDSVAAHANAVLEHAWREIREIASEADIVNRSVFRVLWGRTLLDSGRLTEALAEWNTLMELADSADVPGFQARVRARRGRTLVKLGEAPGAERDLREAVRLADEAGNLGLAIEAYHNLLHLYEEAGRYAEALEAGEQYAARADLEGLSSRRVMSRHDVGDVLRRLGDVEAARRHYEAMVEYVDSLGGQFYFAGEYFERIGDLERAAQYYRRELGVGETPDRANAGLARVAEATGDLEGALRHAGLHDRPLFRLYPEATPILPGVLARAGRLEEARGALQNARREAAERGQVAGWARLLLEASELELRRGSAGPAEALADSAAGAAARVAETEIAVRARAVAALARVHNGIGGEATAVSELGRAVQQARALGLPHLAADVSVLYGDALLLTHRFADGMEALGEAARLTDSIAASLTMDPVRAGYRAAHTHISSRALAAVVAHTRGDEASGWFASWSLARKGRGVLERSQRGSGPVDLSALQARLGRDDVVIDYAVLDTAVVALVLTVDRVDLVRLPVTASSLRGRVRSLLSRVAPRIGGLVDASRAALNLDVAHELYEDLLEPLEPLLAGRANVTVVPDDVIHLVPFDALVDGGTDRRPSYVLDRFRVAYVVSLVDAPTGRWTLGEGGVVAIAGPSDGTLVDAEDELKLVVGALPDREALMLPPDLATERTIRERASGAAVVHFAAHARANDHEPDFAEIRLRSDGDDDGRLHAYEIRDLDFGGALVVLSACETAAGRLAGGEGLLSLDRAFLQAGAAGVVGTLWPVGRVSAPLMDAFYRELADGQPPAVALHRAKLSLRTRPDVGPLAWAAFHLVSRASAQES